TDIAGVAYFTNGMDTRTQGVDVTANLRFAGCNLWTGREEDRADAVCTFCDTDFVGTDGPGGGKFAAAGDLARAVAGAWPNGRGTRFVVCTGGEPLLQLDAPLVQALHAAGVQIAVGANGTPQPPPGLDGH